MNPCRTFILTPAYNAGRTIEQVFQRIPSEASARIERYVVVDDGSTDDTLTALERLRPMWPSLVILRHQANRGYGAAESTLLDYALNEGAEAAVLLHADGQYAPERLPAILAPLDRDEADLVQGSRLLGGGALQGGMPLYKYAANRTLTAVENLAFGMRMAEYHSGYMAYHRRFLSAVPYGRLSASFDYDLEMIALARARGFRIREVPIPTRYADEVSHLNPLTYGLRVLRVVGRYRLGHYHRLGSTPRPEEG